MPSRRDVLAGLGGASTLALAGCLDDVEFTPGNDSDADWPMARFDPTNTAYSSDAVAPRESVRERWTYDGSMATGPPAVVDGTVLLPTTEALVALDAADGTERWRFTTGSQPWSSAPAVHDGVVFATMRDEDTVHAIDEESGEELWSLADVGRVHAAPHLVAGEHVSDPVLYAGTENGAVLRLDPATGEVTWRTDLFGSISTFAYRLPALFVGTAGGEVYAFTDWSDADDPLRESWRRKVGSKVEAIVPDSNCVLVHTFADPLLCLHSDAHTGTTRWSLDAAWANSAPVRARYTVLAAGYDGLSSFREHDREFRWRLSGRYDAVDPVAAGDTLYVSSGTAVHAFALDGGTGYDKYRFGAKRWSHPTPGVATGLAVADGALFVASQARMGETTSLHCLEPA